MKVNMYESAVIINANLEDEQVNNVIARIKDIITKNGGQINDFEDWGRKRLAYTINKSKIGYYVFFRFSGNSALIKKLERAYTLDEYVLRFLTIKLDKNALDYFEKKKSASAESSDVIDEIIEEIPDEIITDDDEEEEE